MSAAAKASGRPERAIAEILRISPTQFSSKRAWGLTVRDLVCQIAASGLDSEKMTRMRNLPKWLVAAVVRQRRINHLISCGMEPKQAAIAANTTT